MSETAKPNSSAKVSPATPRTGKTRAVAKSDPDSASPLQNVRSSVDKSPRVVSAKKPTVGRAPNFSTPTDRKSPRILKPSDLQSQLDVALESLKDANEKLILIEKEKENALEELRQSQKLADEANEKLMESLAAQKRAEEDSEIEKFRAVELEQANIDAAQKKEEEWIKELEIVRNQHAVDMAALLMATQELQKVRQELAMTCDAKNQALHHAEEATKIAEANVEKVESLTAELADVKRILEQRADMVENESKKLETESRLEVEYLREELEKAKQLEIKLAEKDAALEQLTVDLDTSKLELEYLRKELKKAKQLELNLGEKDNALEQLNVDLEAARMAESYARNLVDELHERAEELASQAEHAKRLETSASESLESVMKQLERSNDLLHSAESEIAGLKEEVGLLRIASKRHRTDLEEVERRAELAKQEASEMSKKVGFLTAELEAVKEEKIQSLNNEKLAAASVQTLLEEKNKLMDDLETSRDEEEKSKKALESLASALHEVSAEARDSKEKLLSIQVEHENYESQIEDLKLVLKATNEKYENLLGEAKKEILELTNSIEQSKHDHESFKAEWEQKELLLAEALKNSKSSMDGEVSRLVNLLKVAEEEACATREEVEHWKSSVKESELEIAYLKDILGEAKAESMKYKECLLDKDNELQNIIQENDELKRKECDSQKRVEELSKLLEEASAKLHEKENGELTESEKDYDVLPKVVEFSEKNGSISKEGGPSPKGAMEKPPPPAVVVEGVNGRVKDHDDDESRHDGDPYLKTWESCKIEEKDMSPLVEGGETGQELVEDEVDSKAGDADSYDQVNELSGSPSEQNSSGQKKKKKALFGKFGSMLKKKSPASQK